jgi:peptidyl-prolyl cis-trans isomerase B (cyclophilin B)
VPPIKREREYARRRYSEWQRRQAAAAAARRRRRRGALAVGAVVLAVAVIAGAVWIGSGTSGAPAAAPSPSASSSASSSASPSASYALPPASAAQGRTWTGSLTTSQGAIGVALDGAKAPQAVASFVSLAKAGFFDGTRCHRLVTSGIHVLQCGDPTGTGTGGPGYSFGPVENAPGDDVYPAGTIAMARQGGSASSMGSQFFLVYEDSTIPSDSAGGYTVFGRVTSGLDVVAKVAAGGSDDSNGDGDGKPKTPISIEQVTLQ